MENDKPGIPRKQGSIGASKIITERFYRFAATILRELSERMDRRLVKTFFDLLCVIIILRHRNQGLLLTELGGQLMGMDRAPAGAKRISNLLHSKIGEQNCWKIGCGHKGIRKLKNAFIPEMTSMPFGMKARSKSRRA